MDWISHKKTAWIVLPNFEIVMSRIRSRCDNQTLAHYYLHSSNEAAAFGLANFFLFMLVTFEAV
jgi:hypothetical protein